MSKIVYFLRHGETAGNKSWRHQHNEMVLSATGRSQATEIADALSGKGIEHIITSPLARTRETATIVSALLGVGSIEESALFEELRRPSELINTSWFSLTSLYAMGMLYFKAGTPLWHYSDEENLSEFRDRTFAALEMLAARPEQTILVVTHRGLMSALEERMKRDGKGTVGQYRRALWKNLRINNCCFLTAHWSPEGENGETLTGTWTVEPSITCPANMARNNTVTRE